MTNPEQDFYIDALKHEMAELKDNKFTGSMSFQFNYHGGSIGNMMVNMNKSIKKIGDSNAKQYAYEK